MNVHLRGPVFGSFSRWGLGIQDGATSCKLFYFLFFATMAPFFPYVNLYFRGIGLSGEEIGLISAITPAVGLFMQTVWGTLSDVFRGRRAVLMLTTLAASVLVLFFLTAREFYSLVWMMILFSVFTNPIMPLADSISLRYLEDYSNTGEYGMLRLWGSIGFSLVVPLAGWFLQRTSLANLFILYSVLMFMTHLASRFMPETQRDPGQAPLPFPCLREGNENPPPHGHGCCADRGPGRAGITRLLVNRNFIGFLFAIFILQAATMSVGTFFPIHLSRMGASTLIIGTAQLIAALSEVPAFGLSGRVIARASSRTIITWASATYALRFFVYAMSPTPGPILLVQVVQGLGFALFYSAAVVFVSEVSPPELKTTGQAVFWAFSFGGGAIAGNLGGGFLVDRIGTANLYLLASGGALLSIALLLMAVQPDVNDVNEGPGGGVQKTQKKKRKETTAY
ncbi:MAG: MFS transporter [Firmicutes bacterium]|nr:MFS transporter [Bacillota bacterium]